MLAEPKTRRGNGPSMAGTGMDTTMMGMNMVGVSALDMSSGVGGSSSGGFAHLAGMHLDSSSAASSSYLAGLLSSNTSSGVHGSGGLLLPQSALENYPQHSGYGNGGGQMADHSRLLAAATAAAAAGGSGLDFSALQGYDGGGLRRYSTSSSYECSLYSTTAVGIVWIPFWIIFIIDWYACCHYNTWW